MRVKWCFAMWCCDDVHVLCSCCACLCAYMCVRECVVAGVYSHMVIWWYVCGIYIRIRWCMFQFICIYNPPVALQTFFASRHIGCPSAIDQHHDLSRHTMNKTSHDKLTSNQSEWAELRHRRALLLNSHIFFPGQRGQQVALNLHKADENSAVKREKSLCLIAHSTRS